jgi:hypothetical protein
MKDIQKQFPNTFPWHLQYTFPWNLQSGDEVLWMDPDDEVPRNLFISSVSYHGTKGDPDCIIQITTKEGSNIEVFSHELS